jgi:general secretion pathway protein A
MYEAFYGFRDLPFRLTPDPDYLFLSANHQEALGHLLFGINEGSGVVVITGEIGAGKTTLIRTLVRNLDAQTTVAYVFNPVLSALELLQTINADLGLPATSTSKKELTDALNRFLLSQQAEGRRTVVIIDEAQNLEPAVLEQLRLLSNLETERAKLLQIILIGQPELAEILARPDLTQLDQRVTLRWHLHPLPAGDTGAYIRHRLQVAADGRTSVVFTPGGIRLVHTYSGGVPRLINILCHRALLVAYTREERQISVAVVRQAIDELRRHRQETRSLLRSRSFAFNASFAVGLLFVVGTLSVVAASRGWFSPPLVSTIASQGDPENGPPIVAASEKSATGKREPELALSSSETLPSSWSLMTPQTVLVSPVRSGSLTTTPKAKVPVLSDTTAVTPPFVSPQEEQEQVTTEAFLRDLRAMGMKESAFQASNALLRAWGVDEVRASEVRNGNLDLGALARARRLAYLPFNGSLNLVALLDLPIILEIMLPDIQDTRFVLLLGLSHDRCRIFLERERELPLQVLSENWFGKGYLLWKDFEEIGTQLTVGSVGLNIQRLHRLLANTPGLTENTVPTTRETVFNRQTEASVARFQRAKRLTPDGVVGPLTMILLYNAVPTYTHPRLG